MADFKIIWRFAGNDGSEWSEQYWVGGKANPGEASVIPGALLQARLSLLNNLNTWKSVTAANTAGNRDTSQVVISLQGTDLGGQATRPTPRDHAIILAMSGTTGAKRKLWLRGVSEGAGFLDGVTGIQRIRPDFGHALEAFFSALKAAGYGVRRQTRVVNPALEIAVVLQADGATTPGVTDLLLDRVLNVNLGDTVLIGKVNRKELPNLSGKFTVLKVLPNHITIPYATPKAALVTGVNGSLRKVSYDPIDVFDPAKCSVDHYGAHDTKVPLSRSRGARRAARIRKLV